MGPYLQLLQFSDNYIVPENYLIDLSNHKNSKNEDDGLNTSGVNFNEQV
jgi:hypothetical protein